MVKLKGPLMGTSAAASMADILTYSKNHGRQSARKKTKPKVTRTGKQNGIRVMVGWLAKQWATLAPAQWETWSPLAQETDIAPYHAYISYNMKRWRNWLPPTQEWPADETVTPPRTVQPTAITQWHAIKITIRPHYDIDTWGYILNQHKAWNFPSNFDNLAVIVSNKVGLSETTYYAPVEPPSTHVRIRPFGKTGVWGDAPTLLYVLVD